MIAAWVIALRRGADRTDLLVVVAIGLFALACALSMFPRQSFDAAVTALSWAGAYGVARRVLADATMRRYAIVVVAIVGVVLTLAVLVVWLSIWARWLSLTHWTGLPPLDLDLPSGVWAHRHDLTTLLVLLAPAPWIAAKQNTAARVVAGLVLCATAVVVVMDGSRSVWLALLVASAVIAATRLRQQLLTKRSFVFVGLGLTMILALAFVTGGLDEVLRRLGNVHTLGARTAQWGPALGVFLERPLQGGGPGAYPFVIRMTDYFQTSSYVSLHPDNAYVQLLACVGLLGAASGGAVLAALIVGWRPPERTGALAVWIVLFAAVVALGTNPFAYGFLLAPLTFWAALASPARPVSALHAPGNRPNGLIRTALVVMLMIVAGTQTATVIGAAAFDRAASESANENYPAAIDNLSLAHALDPSLALYVRERGAARMLAGDPTAADDLRLAVRLNPADDIAYRVLSLDLLAQGDTEGALTAAEAAVERSASDVQNLVVLARAFVIAGDRNAAANALAQAVSYQPWLAADPAWHLSIPDWVDPVDLATRAVAGWKEGRYEWVDDLDSIWLLAQVQAGPRQIDDADLNERLLREGEALLGVFSCQQAAASIAELRNWQPQWQAYTDYWLARFFAERSLGIQVPQDVQELAYLRWPQLQPIVEDRIPAADVLSGRFKDQYGYRRPPITHSVAQIGPTGLGGLAAWMNDPTAAASAVGMQPPTLQCGP